MFETKALKDSQALKQILRIADPSYRKRNVFVKTSNTVALEGTYWDEGTRSTYVLVDLKLGQVRTQYPQHNPPQFGGPKTPPLVPIEPGFVIVETGFFCGKVATATVHKHREETAL